MAEARSTRRGSAERRSDVVVESAVQSVLQFSEERYNQALSVLDKPLPTQYAVGDALKRLERYKVIYIPWYEFDRDLEYFFSYSLSVSKTYTLPELLDDYKGEIKNDLGLDLGDVIASLRDAVRLVKVRGRKVTASADLTVGPVRAGAGAESSRVVISEAHVDTGTLSVVLRFILSRLNKAPRFVGDRVGIILTPTDVEILGAGNILDAVRNLRRVVVFVTAPSEPMGDEVFKLLGSDIVGSVFMPIDWGLISDYGGMVHELERRLEGIAIRNREVKHGLAATLKILREIGVLQGFVKWSLHSTGNPLIAADVLIDWLSRMYGYMNRDPQYIHGLLSSDSALARRMESAIVGLSRVVFKSVLRLHMRPVERATAKLLRGVSVATASELLRRLKVIEKAPGKGIPVSRWEEWDEYYESLVKIGALLLVHRKDEVYAIQGPLFHVAMAVLKPRVRG